MPKHRIVEARNHKKWKQIDLARELGIDPGYLSRVESGERGLSIRLAQQIAKKTGKTTAFVMNLDEGEGSSPSGFRDDVVPYVSGDDDRLTKIQSEHRYLLKVDGNVLDNIDIRDGDAVEINDSQKARDDLHPLDVVQVAFHSIEEPNRAIQLLRQFVPPSLLITNCSTGNMPSIDINVDDAQIVGVVEAVHRAMRRR